MSRRIVWCLAVVLMSVVAVNAFAAAGDIQIGASGGIMKLTGDAGKGWKTGYLGGVAVDYMINDMWAAGADFTYNTAKHEDDGKDAADIYPGLTGTIKDKLTLMQYGLHGKFMFPMKDSPVQPYALLGVGMYNVKEEFSAGDFSEDASVNKFGGHGGLGATWNINEQFGVGAEGDYHFISTEGTSTTYFGVMAGVTFKIPAKK